MLSTDETVLTSHTEEDLHQVINQFSHASREFALTVSICKSSVMGQNVPAGLSITIDNMVFENTDQCTYLGSAITSNLSFGTGTDRRVAKAVSVDVIEQRVWNINNNLEDQTQSVSGVCAQHPDVWQQMMGGRKTVWRLSPLLSTTNIPQHMAR